MSGVFGVLRLDGAPVGPAELALMAKALRHRGPDGVATWADGCVGLGHALMRTNAEDRLGRQPLHDPEAGLTLVADARLDNRAELAEALGIDAPRLRELPDSALILAACRRWGDEAPVRLLGDFVFALWDARQRRLTLACDHVGQRSCFFHKGPRALVFASEVSALWSHPETPRQLSDAGIARLLMGDVATRPGVTIFEDVEGLSGGRMVTVTAAGALTSRAYWSPHADPSHTGRDEAYYVEAYRAVLGEAVACRVRRTLAPPGMLLSGGFDSSAVAALAGAPLGERKLVAVSSVMAADYQGSIRHARPWVELCRRDMPHLDVRYLTRERLDFVDAIDRSFAWVERVPGPYAVVQHAMFEMLSEAGVRVVMDGYGGDQTLNPRGLETLAWLAANHRWPRFFRELEGARQATGRSRSRILRTDVLAVLFPGLAHAWRRLRRGRPPPFAGAPVTADFAHGSLAAGLVTEAGLRANQRVGLDVMRAAIARRIGKPNSTASAAACGLEPARPYDDKRVVELALAIPPDLHVKDGRNRYLACRALADLYPPEFQTRWRRNDDQIPDFQATFKAAEPRMLREIERMEGSGALSRYVDFEAVRALWAARGADEHNSGWEEETQAAVGAFAVARYVEWFRGYN